jgi:rod shape-determining protein MreC
MALQSHGARRRYVLLIIVLSALTLATLNGRAGQSGPIGSVGNAVHRVVQPFASAADTVFSPVHDWFDSVIHSGHLKRDNRKLRQQIAALRARERRVDQAILENGRYRTYFGKPFIDDYTRIGAWVQSGSIDNLSHTITIDRGTEAGIVQGMAVIAGDGLVGRIFRSWPGGSEVLLATDPSFGAAINMVRTGLFGTAQTQPDHSLRVVFPIDSRHPAVSAFKTGDVATTCGCQSSDFPAGIPVGSVQRATPSGPEVTVRLEPFVDFGALDVVQVVLWTSHDPIPKDPALHPLPPVTTTTVPTTTTTTAGGTGTTTGQTTTTPTSGP